MDIPIYQIDAFTDRPFGGNPAAVCPLDDWLPDAQLLAIAVENNLAETAFFTHLAGNRYHLRWFTPEIEMDLCGHATLASAFVLFECLSISYPTIQFETQGGLLTVEKTGRGYTMDLPNRPPKPATLPDVIRQSLNHPPMEVWKARDYLLVYPDQDTVASLRPDEAMLSQINIHPGGIIATAQGQGVDFVSRFFTPQAAIFEDPVTGSAHCTLVPYWAGKLGKSTLLARQISKRQGTLQCQLLGERVAITGQAIKYMAGTIFV